MPRRSKEALKMTEEDHIKDEGPSKFVENDAGDGTTREEMYLTGAKLYLCVLSNVCCLILVGLDQTIVSTILDDVGSKFNALNKVGWLVSGFLLPSTVFAANWGQLSIIFGRKYAMLAAVLIFEVGSVVCAVANNMNTLIGGRVLAGVGASGIQGLAFIICSEIAPIHKRAFVFALLGLVMSVAVVLGPLIGGALASNVSWRWCFYINLPIGGAAVAFFCLTFHPPRPKFDLRQKFKLIDYLGTFLVASGLTLFLVGLTFASTRQFAWKSGPTISCIVLGVLLSIGFCVWNFKYSKVPIIPLKIVQTWGVTASGMTMCFVFAFFMPLLLYLSIYFQIIFNQTPLQAGISILALIIPTIVSSVVAGIVVGKTRYIKPFSVFAGIVGVIGTGLVTLLDIDSTSSERIGYCILIGVGCGVGTQTGFTGGQVNAPKIDGGIIMASSFVVFLRGFGGAWSTIIGDIVYNASLRNKYKAAYDALPEGTLKDHLESFSIDKISSDSSILGNLQPDALRFVKVQIMGAIRNVFYFCIGTAVVMLVFTVFGSNMRIPAKETVRTKEEREEIERNRRFEEGKESVVEAQSV